MTDDEIREHFESHAIYALEGYKMYWPEAFSFARSLLVRAASTSANVAQCAEAINILSDLAAVKRYSLDHHISGKGRTSTTLNVPNELLGRIDTLLQRPVTGDPADDAADDAAAGDPADDAAEQA